MMAPIQPKYSNTKPKECRYCYFWEKKACSRGIENCYYLIKEPKKTKSECTDCPYKKSGPCLGHCTRKILQELRNNKE